MKISGAFVLTAILACALADNPPIPYAAASTGAQSASFPRDGLHSQADNFHDRYGAGGFADAHSGYEGYLVAPGLEHGLLPFGGDGLELKGHSGHGHLAALFGHLASAARKALPKLATGAVLLLGLFLVGACVNALVCSLTPFCSISFAPGFGVTKDAVGSYLDPDRISSTATYVMDAIKKYRSMYDSLSNEIDSSAAKKAKK